MASSTFYSKPRAKRPPAEDAVAGRLAKRLAAAERYCKSSVVTSQRDKRSSAAGSRELLLVPHKFWKFFSRQQPAIDFARTSPGNLHVFSFEDPLLGGQGRRRFLVSSYLKFYSWYKSTKKCERTFYEVIPEGCVCRLYFDLEYATEHNADHAGDRSVEIFVEAVCFYVRQEFSVECCADHVLDLDSSTAKKFSRHLIFHLENCCFQNNVEAGRFVQYVCADLLRRIKSREPLGQCLPACTLQQLIIRKSDGAEDLFCDQGVYTRNRNFRLLGSSKLGKRAYLSVAAQSRFMYRDVERARDSLNTDLLGTQDANQYSLFRASLICAVSFPPNSNPRVLTFRSGPSQSPLPYSAATKAPADTTGKLGGGCGSGDASHSMSSASFSPSPFPHVDRFVLSMLPRRSRDNVPGVIRKWFYFSEGKTLSYDIGGNRWCQNVGRHHKSNHILIVVDLAANSYYQKCHDPDCRRSDYRSPESPLPAHLLKRADVKQEGTSYVQEGEMSGAELEEVLAVLELTDVYVHHFWDADDTASTSATTCATGSITAASTAANTSSTATTNTSNTATTNTSSTATTNTSSTATTNTSNITATNTNATSNITASSATSSAATITATSAGGDGKHSQQSSVEVGDIIIGESLYDALLYDDDDDIIAIDEAMVSVEMMSSGGGGIARTTTNDGYVGGHDGDATDDSTDCIIVVAPPQRRTNERTMAPCGATSPATASGVQDGSVSGSGNTDASTGGVVTEAPPQRRAGECAAATGGATSLALTSDCHLVHSDDPAPDSTGRVASLPPPRHRAVECTPPLLDGGTTPPPSSSATPPAAAAAAAAAPPTAPPAAPPAAAPPATAAAAAAAVVGLSDADLLRCVSLAAAADTCDDCATAARSSATPSAALTNTPGTGHSRHAVGIEHRQLPCHRLPMAATTDRGAIIGLAPSPSASCCPGGVAASRLSPRQRTDAADGCSDAELRALGLDHDSYSQLFDASQDAIA